MLVFLKKGINGLLELVFLGKLLIYGYFKDIKDAIRAREEAEEEYFKPILKKYKKRLTNNFYFCILIV